MQRIKISAVAYLNSKPLIYGLTNTEIRDKIELSLDIPSVCAEKLISGKVDIGLVPVAVLPQLKEYYILSDYCIGAVGAVSSVMLYSNVPLPEIEGIFLDYQSRTSVQLVQILAKNFWNISPEWIKASEGYESEIKKNIAALIIGDRTFGLENKYLFKYDLAEEWQKYTNLPFVFACWVANKPLPPAFIKAFGKSVEYGIKNKEKAIQQWSEKNHYSIDVRNYLEKYISYELDAEKRKGMELFFRLMAS